jgi:hypothetical protein
MPPHYQLPLQVIAPMPTEMTKVQPVWWRLTVLAGKSERVG